MALVADLIIEERHLEELGQLLDRCFPVPAGAHFFDDFPVWSSIFNENVLRFGIFEDDKVVGSTAVRLANVKGLGTCALIGGVAMDTPYRGKGFASDLVTLARQWAEERGALYAFLWGSEHSMYQKLGFNLVGEQVRVPLADLKLDMTSPVQVHEGWHPGIWELLRMRRGGLELREKDLKWIQAHKNVKWFWAGTTLTQPEAYLAVGKGIDLVGLVHEWGGELALVKGLMAEVHRRTPDHSLLASPVLHRDLLSPLGSGLSELKSEALCMAAQLQKEALPLPDNLWFWGLDGA